MDVTSWSERINTDSTNLREHKLAAVKNSLFRSQDRMQTTGSTPDFINVLCIDDLKAKSLAGGLFQRCFRQPIPNFPKHYVAVHRSTPEQALAYVHFTLKACELNTYPSGHFILGGGLCIDEHAYRRLSAIEQAAIRSAGGIAQITLGKALDDSSSALAVFGLIGDKRSARVVTRLGFKETRNPQIKVKCNAALTTEAQEMLLRLAEAEGAF